MERSPSHSDWLCTNHRAVPISPGMSRRIDRLGSALLDAGSGRVARQSWVRYHINLSHLPERPPEVVLEPITAQFMASLRQGGTGETDNQIRTAMRFWDNGLRSAFVWLDKGEPLCMQWLLHARHFAALPRLGSWSGMYPPVSDDCGIVENIYSFPSAHERVPGAATKLAIAVLHEARRRGYRELQTHVVQSNLAAHRWARRIGLKPYGIIDRYGIKLPRVPITYLCHHQSCEIRNLQPRHRSGTGARRSVPPDG